MRWIGFFGALWAQSVCVLVDPAYKSLRGALREGMPTSIILRQDSLWRGLFRAEALSLDTSEIALGGWFVLRFQGEDSLSVIRRLEASGFFRVVEPLRTRKLCSTLNGWHHLAIQTAQAWTRTYGSPHIPIAIIDTGIDTALSAFAGQYYINPAEDLNRNGRLDPADLNGIDDDQNGYIDDVIGYDFTDQGRLIALGDAWGPDPFPLDENGHGTAMASLIAAKPGSGPVQGIAPGCPILIVRAFSADGYGEDDDIVRGILYAVRRGARVISCSFGDEVPSQMMAAAIRYAVGRGVVVVASSGNGTGGRPHYPSGFPEVLAAGAASFDPERGSYFLWPLSGYSRVDWVAPGDQLPVLLPGGIVRSLSGTSLSAAITSAAVALILSMYPRLSPEEVRATLTTAALDIGAPGWDVYTGAGLLRLPLALDYPQSGTVQWLSPSHDSHYGLAPIPLRLRVYHSLLSHWEVSWATSLQGPWLGNLRATAPTWDTTLIWRPPHVGRWLLRLTAYLRSGNALTTLCPVFIDTSSSSFIETRLSPAWHQNLLGYAASYLLSKPLPVCVFHPAGQTCIDRIDSAGATWLGPLSLPAVTFSAITAQETLSVPVSTPSVSPAALGIDNHQIRNISAPAGFYWAEPLPDWNGDGFPDLLATLYGPDGAYNELAFLARSGTAYRPYDSIPGRTALPRHLADWDGDGHEELLCVWYDSFFVYGGTPPKNLLYAGKGLAARIDYPYTVCVRTPAGHYEQHTQEGLILRRLLDTTGWEGSTTIPRLLKLRHGPDSLWVFGNYPGHLFAYRDETLIGTYATRLEQVGSYIYAIDIDNDGYDEVLYLGRHKSKRVWRLGLLSLNPWQEIASVEFWAEGEIRPRLLVRGDGRFLLWLPPQVYFGRVVGNGFVWEAYGPWSWDACTPAEGGWLLGVDTLSRIVDFTEGILPPPPWKKAGAVSPTLVSLAWETVSGATTYEVWRFQPRQNPVRIYLGSGTDCLDTVNPGDTCYYGVRAVGGSFGELRRILPGPRPCLQIHKILPKDGQIHLIGNSLWDSENPEAFQLSPQSVYPVTAISSGAYWSLFFGQSLSAGTYTLRIDTLLTDAYGRFLSADCDSLSFTISLDTTLSCLLPLQWEVTSDTIVEVTFSEALPPQAYDPASYQLFPTGRVTCIQEVAPNRLRLVLSVSPRRYPVSIRWHWNDTLCPHTIAFHPRAETLSEWGLFPNPVRGHPQVSFWGLPPKATISILSPSGTLCNRFRVEPDTPIPSWNLRTLTGQRIEPGLYLILIEYQGQKAWEKLYVEE